MKFRKQSLILMKWRVLVFCFILAVTIYFAMFYAHETERRIMLPLNIILPERFDASSLIPENAEVVIKGKESQIYMIDISKIKIYADFSTVENKGVATVPVKIDYADLLDYIDTDDLSIFTKPSVVKIFFE